MRTVLTGSLQRATHSDFEGRSWKGFIDCCFPLPVHSGPLSRLAHMPTLGSPSPCICNSAPGSFHPPATCIWKPSNTLPISENVYSVPCITLSSLGWISTAPLFTLQTQLGSQDFLLYLSAGQKRYCTQQSTESNGRTQPLPSFRNPKSLTVAHEGVNLLTHNSFHKLIWTIS